MSRLTLFRVGFLFLILFFTTTAKAQKEAETFNVDSTLYEYYQRCQEYLLEPVVLNMSDTLFRMAGERQDERMQAVAIATQLDYYYFQGTNEDSVIHYTNKVKEFAKATHQPKYYYFAWANRLITYYLKTSRTNIALYEVQNMLKEAQKEDDKDAAQQQRVENGLARCPIDRVPSAKAASVSITPQAAEPERNPFKSSVMGGLLIFAAAG